jgi:hypothetical protein
MTDLEPHARSYELAFQEGARALDSQERAVNELRSRAGVLIAAAAITTSFFGSRAVTGGPPSMASWAAIVSFALVIALHRARSCTANEVLLGRLYWAFRAGLVLVAAEVCAWILALGGQG